jgi:hypothetical protein
MRLPMIGFLAIAAVVTGCREQTPLPAKMVPGATVTVRGRLAEGAECPMLIAANDRSFALGGDLGRFRTGDRVCVTGTVSEMSICMQGEATIAIQAIAPEDSCP